MRQQVRYRFKIERSQLVPSLRKHCDKISGIWVECKFSDVAHIPSWGDRVTGGGFELRVFDVQFYLHKAGVSLCHEHSVLVECMMTEPVDRDSPKCVETLIVPRASLVTKSDLRSCRIHGWTVTGIDQEVIS